MVDCHIVPVENVVLIADGTTIVGIDNLNHHELLGGQDSRESGGGRRAASLTVVSLRLGDEEDDLLMPDLAGLVKGIEA